jgi:hypothetical protein
MNIEILKTIGAVGGIAGIALYVFYLLFRDVLKKNIFPRLGKTQGYRLLRLFMFLVWSLVMVIVIMSRFPGQQNRVRVTDLAISLKGGGIGPNAMTWHTPCPVTVDLTGNITAIGEGTVTYKFIYKIGLDGIDTPTETMSVDFDGPSKTIPVAGKITVPFPEGEYYYTAYLKITDPGDRQSEPVGFTMWCDPNTEPAPLDMHPPPIVEPPSP